MRIFRRRVKVSGRQLDSVSCSQEVAIPPQVYHNAKIEGHTHSVIVSKAERQNEVERQDQQTGY
ncbi:MAG: hypothetical protein IJ728_12695, partial [Selenomonadaceae bacterium]|nr:hypothetical protein [Selenomonadaceae bacterium]